MNKEIYAKIDGLRDLFNEKFNENSKEHIAMWEQVSKTNGRVRLLEKAIWGIGGAITTLALLFSPQAISAVLELLK